MRELSNSEQNLVSGGAYAYPEGIKEFATIHKGNRYYWLLGPFLKPFDNRFNLHTNLMLNGPSK